MSSAHEMELDEFLNDQGSGGGKGGGYLGNWRDDGKIDVWFHPDGKPAKLWSHRWWQFGKDKDTGAVKLVPSRFVSHEKDSVLKRSRFREDDGSREVPPELCPFSLALEWVYQTIRSGEIKWTDVIFRFETEEEEIEIHAGGWVGMFGDRKMPEKKKAELRKAKIRLDEAWKENGNAKCEYVFRVVRHAKPEAGCCRAIEREALGRKVQKVIGDKMEAKHEKGNPFKFPYAFRWKFDDDQDFDKKYDVIALEHEVPPEVQAVFDEPAPSIDDLLRPGNIAVLRTSFEEHWCHEVVPPWDEIFGPAEEKYADDPEIGEAPTDFPHGANEKKSKSETSKIKKNEPEEEESEDEDDEELEDNDAVACDACSKAMSATATKCPHCGVEYNEDGSLKKKEEPKPRSAARKSGRRAASSA